MIHTARNYQVELEKLYARKAAIDDLIASLEAYERYRANTPVQTRQQQRKSA